MDSPDMQKLRVAHPRQTQLATFTPSSATGGATSPQPTSVKALAERVLWRNKERNFDATTDEQRRNNAATEAEFRRRLEWIAAHLGADLDDLHDWYQFDAADFCRMSGRELLPIVRDYLDLKHFYRRHT